MIKLFPSLYSNKQLERNTPQTLEEAASQAVVLHKSFQATAKQHHPYFTALFNTAISCNNRAADFLSNHPNLSFFGGAALSRGIAYLTARSISSSTLISSISYSVITPISLYTLCKLCTFLKHQDPLLGEYQKEMVQLIEETKQLCPTTLFPIVEASLQTSGIQQMFFKSVLSSIAQDLNTASLTKHMVYEVKHEGFLTGHIIGTIHLANPNVAQDRALHQLVERCNRLYVEWDSFFNTAARFYQNHFYAERNCAMLDFALIDTAKKNDIPVGQLDVPKNIITLLSKYALQVSGITESSLTSYDPNIIRRARHPSDLQLLELQHAYLQADSQELYRLGQALPDQMRKELLTDRNKAWLQGKIDPFGIGQHPGLVKLFDSREQSPFSLPSLFQFSPAPARHGKITCVAVGVLHCLGPDGLVLQLRERGYDVKKISLP